MPATTLSLHVVGRPGVAGAALAGRGRGGRGPAGDGAAGPRRRRDPRARGRRGRARRPAVRGDAQLGRPLLALSLGRPVSRRPGRSRRQLAEEVGAGWVPRYAGRARRADIAAALSRGPHRQRLRAAQPVPAHIGPRPGDSTPGSTPMRSRTSRPTGVRWRRWWLSSMSGHQIDLRDTSHEVGLASGNPGKVRRVEIAGAGPSRRRPTWGSAHLPPATACSSRRSRASRWPIRDAAPATRPCGSARRAGT